MHELLIQPLCTANCFDPNLYSLFKILNINISIAFRNTNSQEQKPEPCSQKFNFFHIFKNQHTIQNIHIVLSPLFSLNNQSNNMATNNLSIEPGQVCQALPPYSQLLPDSHTTQRLANTEHTQNPIHQFSFSAIYSKPSNGS